MHKPAPGLLPRKLGVRLVAGYEAQNEANHPGARAKAP